MAAATSIRPAPMSSGSAGVVSSSLTTLVFADVMSADLTWPGVQNGWTALTRIAAPATCGADIDVPAIAWKYSPGGPASMASGVGVLPARIWTPGAVTSGLMYRPPGPRDENAAMTSPVPLVLAPAVNSAVAPGWAIMNALNAVPSARWMAGSQWLSVSTSASDALYRIIPAASPWRTL